MADFIKVGYFVINMDLVTNVVIDEDERFVGISFAGDERPLEFDGPDADLLARWFGLVATELEDMGQADGGLGTAGLMIDIGSMA